MQSLYNVGVCGGGQEEHLPNRRTMIFPNIFIFLVWELES